MNAKTTGSWVVIAMAVIGVLVVLFSKSAAVEAAYPVEKAKVSFSRKVLTRVKGLWNGMQARAENVRLRTEVASLAMEQAEIARVRDENARLRAALQYREGLSEPGSRRKSCRAAGPLQASARRYGSTRARLAASWKARSCPRRLGWSDGWFP